jgi:hypothetical protein
MPVVFLILFYITKTISAKMLDLVPKSLNNKEDWRGNGIGKIH